MKHQPPSSPFQSRATHLMVGPDSPVVYIVCHFISCLLHGSVICAFIWLAYHLNNPWVLLGLAFHRYCHTYDFNRVRLKKRLRKHAEPAAADAYSSQPPSSHVPS